ncbi:hypothetical protein BB8028_0007g04200 [Beauveria bassiana]|uniref:non-specific serine/threonine protein kinase n=1 Tax=Beauveria bassiana TaxID=176275 RepID=A0A2S7YM16_BEABA|nr:hypothetical protein BB8028_0007g04200 [Beauveria bassiana]
MERFTTRPIFNILHQEEELTSYYYGGLHPVCLGDESKDGRYRVVHKLGRGGFSTVWLVRDTQVNRWAALKVLKTKSLLSAANVAFTTRNLVSLSEKAPLDVIGSPETAELLNADGTFASSTLASRDVLAQPIDLRVPETLFGTEFNYKFDLWRLGCVISALIFLRYSTQSLGDNSFAAAQMIDFVEDLPPEWEEAWQKLKAKLSFSLSPVLEPKLVTMFRDRVPDKELAPLLPVIQGLVRLRAAERMSVRAALEPLP